MRRTGSALRPRPVRRLPRVRAAGGVVLVALLPAPVMAKWTFDPRVSASETWSDNINQAPSSTARGDFVTEVTPGIGIRGRGGRLTLDFDYQASEVYYARGSESRRLDHRLQAIGNAEVLQDLFFLDVRSTVSQRNQSSSGQLSTDTLSTNSNREQAVTYGLSPYLQYHLGSFADSELRYQRQEVDNSSSVGTTADSLSLSFKSGKRFAVMPWTLNVNYRKESNTTGTASTYRDVTAGVRYQFTRRYGVRVSAGMENNDLVGETGDTSGLTWRVAGIWTPTQRTSIELGYGKRFFGNSISLDASHRMRRAIFKMGYSQDSTTSASRQLSTQLFPLQDAFGQDIAHPGLAQVNVPTDDPTISDQVLTTKTFSFGVDFRGRRSNGGVRFRDERRQGGAADEHITGVDANLTHRLNPKTSAIVASSIQKSDAGGNDTTLWNVDLGLTRVVYKDVNARLKYRHQRSSSDGAGSSYQEHRLTVDLTVLF